MRMKREPLTNADVAAGASCSAASSASTVAKCRACAPNPALAVDVPLAAIAQGLQAFEPVVGRSRLHRLQWRGRALTLVDDAYNANPDSVRAAIDVLAALDGPRWLLLGDMGEVGAQGPAFHAEVGDYARERGIDRLWTVGELCVHAARAYGPAARHFDSVEAMIAALDAAEPVAAALVKGSKFMRMPRVVQAVLQGGTHAA